MGILESDMNILAEPPRPLAYSERTGGSALRVIGIRTSSKKSNRREGHPLDALQGPVLSRRTRKKVPATVAAQALSSIEPTR